MANPRKSPYIWVTWLAKVMSGDVTCHWQSWFQSHNQLTEKQSGDFDSAIIIRSMTLQKGKAYIRAGAGIVYDSIPESEFLETERKAGACIAAIKIAEESK